MTFLLTALHQSKLIRYESDLRCVSAEIIVFICCLSPQKL